MELRKIDTLEELEREKIRLRNEAASARELFQTQLTVTAKSGKDALLSNWKTVLPIVAAVGTKKFFSRSPEEDYHAAQEPNSLLENIQEGLHIIQRPGNEKWIALFPVVKRLFDHWQLRNYANSEEDGLPLKNEHKDVVSPTNSNAVSSEPSLNY